MVVVFLAVGLYCCEQSEVRVYLSVFSWTVSYSSRQHKHALLITNIVIFMIFVVFRDGQLVCCIGTTLRDGSL